MGTSACPVCGEVIPSDALMNLVAPLGWTDATRDEPMLGMSVTRHVARCPGCQKMLVRIAPDGEWQVTDLDK